MYEYDVYISYDRESETVSPWVRHHFYPRLKELLNDNLPKKVQVFFDQEVGIGAKWPDALYEALRCTRVLVAVLSPMYFESEWCVAEWDSMVQREEDMGMHTYGLIYPVTYSDSRHFPDWATRRRPLDLRPWNQPPINYQDTHAYFDFRKAVERLAESMVDAVLKPPDWQPDWPILQPVPSAVAGMRLPRLQP
ncbi:toll/interleukin-1 receptor domain-containing protein [Actinokineospora globicatena]|uniref:toll/interleukin-1 receptor domain-containing protein n=1 Tax=Actinokineospora globicatena TaxID=103729 RepID=UPI0020A4CE61|nr:toll/interleukin-1 receptor domain-containing protein [Actinokineospora globicatena]MCP2305900.1 TIR domain-containing protein [Actinokineospora globicatena]GLW80231.1 hypothetical protein Aglo01_47120 [Actinokineospora globicatena]GLW87060.1 hypothetical protein Aglo02_46990 [Actinokineospora globicatena]